MWNERYESLCRDMKMAGRSTVSNLNPISWPVANWQPCDCDRIRERHKRAAGSMVCLTRPILRPA